MPRRNALSQQPSNPNEALEKILTGYRTRIQKMRETFMYGEANLLNIKKEIVETFIKELSAIIKGLEEHRSEPHIRQCLTSVDAVVDKVGLARSELTLISYLLTQKDTESRVKSRLDHYRKSQNYLAEAIKPFDPLTKRISRGK